MKFLAIEKENKGVIKEDFSPHLKAEAKTVWDLYQSDVIREIYFDKERSSAVLILECKDRREADKLLSTLPIVKQQLVNFDIYQLGPYHGFGRLMNAD